MPEEFDHSESPRQSPGDSGNPPRPGNSADKSGDRPATDRSSSRARPVSDSPIEDRSPSRRPPKQRPPHDQPSNKRPANQQRAANEPPINPEDRDDDDFEREIETTARPVGSKSSSDATTSRRPSARSIAASQALVSTPTHSRSSSSGPTSAGERSRDGVGAGRVGVSSRGDYGSRDYGTARGYRPRSDSGTERRGSYDRRSYGDRYSGRAAAGGGGFGGGDRGGAVPQGSKGKPKKLGGVTVIAIAILVAFFTGFAMRDLYTAKSGFDDERFVQAEQVPSNLRQFCVDYNGLPSFTLLNVASTSALSATTVPVLKLDTCTIPTNQTANALQALGVDRRATSIGLQLGGSNLTLVNLPVTGSLSVQLLAQFPSLEESLSGRDRDMKEKELEDILDTMLRSGANGLALQNIIKTNKTDVYAIAPGHTFQLQPDIQAPSELQ